jgi:hypothetical protein
MPEIGWNFPTDPADQWAGFNDAGIEHFRGEPYGNLAREAIQNSLDAGLGGQVEISFQLREVPCSEIPNVDEFSGVLRQCLQVADAEGKKAKEFFERAIACLGRSTLKVLTIADDNTTGMAGPAKNGSAYYAYMKATGQSKKESDTAAGSYGIGKYAPLAVSELRTLFVSTVAQGNPTGLSQYTQGKSILMSHNENGRTKQGTGYWGVNANCMPIEGITNVPTWILRPADEVGYGTGLGTTLHVIGFDVIPHWEDMLTASVLENFFGAISSGTLAVYIQERLISKDTIGDFFLKDSIRSAVEGMKGEPDKFDYSKLYHQALVRAEDVLVENHENRELGNCEVRIMLGEQLPKKVAFLRNGMFITDQLDRLKRFSGYKEFVAIVQCKSTKGNELLRAMEPPRHDDFEPDRLVSKSEKQRAKRSLAEVANWVKEMLNRYARDPVSEVTQISELADYFGDDAEPEGKGTGEETNPEGGIEIRAQPLPKRPSKIVRESEVVEGGEGDDGGGGRGDDGEGGDGGGGDGGGSGDSSGGGGGSNIGKKVVGIPLSDVRSVPLAKNIRRVAFTPSRGGLFHLVLFEAGADVDRRLAAARTTNGLVQDGRIVGLLAIPGMRMSLDVELQEPFEGSMKVVGYEI